MYAHAQTYISPSVVWISPKRLFSQPTDEPAEVRGAVEVHPGCHLLSRELGVAEQVADFHNGELLNPVTGRASAHLRRDFVEVFGGDAEFCGVICYGPVLSVCPRLQHSDEARHDVCGPLRRFFVLEEGGVGVHHVEVERAHALHDGLVAVRLGRVGGAESHVLEVVADDNEGFPFQLEDGVHEEVEPAASAVAAVGHAAHLLLGGQQELQELAVVAEVDTPHMTCHRYHARAATKRMLASGEAESARPGRTEKVKNLLLHAEVQRFLPLQKYEKKGIRANKKRRK